jgi:hypothetical protein
MDQEDNDAVRTMPIWRVDAELREVRAVCTAGSANQVASKIKGQDDDHIEFMMGCRKFKFNRKNTTASVCFRYILGCVCAQMTCKATD